MASNNLLKEDVFKIPLWLTFHKNLNLCYNDSTQFNETSERGLLSQTLNKSYELHMYFKKGGDFLGYILQWNNVFYQEYNSYIL